MKKKKKNYLLEKVIEIMANEPKEAVLDLGCGDGDYSHRLKELGFQVTASDMDFERFKYHNEIEFKQSDLSNPLPFDDTTFDYVLFLEVIEHLRNPFFVISQISRILKNNGKLIISTPNILNLGSRMRFLFEGAFDFYREPTLDFAKIEKTKNNLQNIHIVVWRYHELEYLLYENNLEMEDVYTDLLKPQLQFLFLLLNPIMSFQAWTKERKALKKLSVDFRRMNKILFKKELLYGRHLILMAKKFSI